MDREDPARITAATIGVPVLVELPNGQQSLLGVINIDCPVCGKVQYQIAGHHLPTVLKLLAQWADEFPELTRDVIVKETQTRFQGPSNDPTTS